MQNRKGNNIVERGTRNAKALKITGLCMAACLLFCAGFLVRGNHDLMVRLGVESDEATLSLSEGVSGNASDLAERVNEVSTILAQDSLDSYDLDTATVAVMDAFLDTTDDSYTHYFDKSRYSSYVEVSADEYPGVGVFFAEHNGQAYALDVFEGSSAASEGVESGDFVVAIDGDRSQEWTATEVINAVQREEGSTVAVTWRRPASLDAKGGEEFTTTLLCAEYEEPNVSTQLVGTVGYISLKQISQNADVLVREAIKELADDGARSFVFDLRDNPGGYLTKAVDVASLFIKSGVVVEIETMEATTTKQASGEIATSSPLVVLINGNTAGSAEVLAAALRDSDRATLVGETTMGKGSVQVTQPLSFGGALRYTAARYKSPSGYSIDGVGVSPTITVARGEDASSDSQKEVALETAASLGI